MEKNKKYCLLHRVDCYFYDVGRCAFRAPMVAEERANLKRLHNCGVYECDGVDMNTTTDQREAILAGVSRKIEIAEEIRDQNTQILEMLQRLNDLII